VWQNVPQNASELDQITALFVTATNATPLSPNIVPHRKIHWTTPQNPRFGRSFGALLGSNSTRNRSLSVDVGTSLFQFRQ
jgi:hypothetical protein